MTLLITSTPKFELGEVFATSGAFAAHSPGVLLECLNRHAAGDWGDLDEEDLAANEAALLSGSRLFSSYLVAGGRKLWVITEHDRSATTVLLPEEY